MKLKVRPIRRIRARITMPGDKSISHRAAILASFAMGTTRISNFLNSEDCLCTMQIMQALGTKADRVDDTTYIVEGRDGKYLKAAESLDCGNSGTSMRLIAGLLATQPFSSALFGDASLNKRPMKRIIDPLSKMGAEIVCEGEDFRPPLRINGKPLHGIAYHTPVPSAQVKSCVLLAGLQAEGKTEVTEDAATRDHTERMLRHFNASIQRQKNHITLYGQQRLQSNDIEVPGDFSSGAFWLVAASAMPGSTLILDKIGLNPTRTGLLNILLRMGANIVENVYFLDAEPSGALVVKEGTTLKATVIGGAEIPNVIDELPILAVAAALAQGTTVIKDAQELRVKETDRIAALATNLRAFGVRVEEQPDGLIIEGCPRPRGAKVNSFADHRIAMAFAILGLFCEGETVIEDTACIATSYPTFEKDLARLTSHQKWID